MIFATSRAAVGLSTADILRDAVEVLGGLRCRSQAHLRAQYFLDIGPNFRVLHELAALRGGDATLYASTKAGVVVQQAQGSVFHQIVQCRRHCDGQSARAGLPAQGEMDFRSLQGSGCGDLCQRGIGFRWQRVQVQEEIGREEGARNSAQPGFQQCWNLNLASIRGPLTGGLLLQLLGKVMEQGSRAGLSDHPMLTFQPLDARTQVARLGAD